MLSKFSFRSTQPLKNYFVTHPPNSDMFSIPVAKYCPAKENGGGLVIYAPFEQRFFGVPEQIAAELKLAHNPFGRRIDAERSPVAVNSELGAASAHLYTY